MKTVYYKNLTKYKMGSIGGPEVPQQKCLRHAENKELNNRSKFFVASTISLCRLNSPFEKTEMAEWIKTGKKNNNLTHVYAIHQTVTLSGDKDTKRLKIKNRQRYSM